MFGNHISRIILGVTEKVRISRRLGATAHELLRWYFLIVDPLE